MLKNIIGYIMVYCFILPAEYIYVLTEHNTWSYVNKQVKKNLNLTYK